MKRRYRHMVANLQAILTNTNILLVGTAVMPPRLRHVLAQKKAKLHVVDATQVALTARLGKRINTVMQTVFFMLSGVLPKEKALQLYKDEIRRTYAHKGMFGQGVAVLQTH